MRHLTVEDLAAAKRLPAEFLRHPRVGLHDLPDGVGIPYYDMTGEEIAVKRRTAVVAGQGSYWPKGQPLSAYGLWRLDEAQRAGVLFVVEGESDCWALWHHGLPALGFPGANSVWEAFDPAQLDSVPMVYVSREPGQGGAQFVEDIRWAMVAHGWRGRAYSLRWPGSTKDAAGLHQCCADTGQRFLDHVQEMILSSRAVPSGFPTGLYRMMDRMVDNHITRLLTDARALKRAKRG